MIEINAYSPTEEQAKTMPPRLEFTGILGEQLKSYHEQKDKLYMVTKDLYDTQKDYVQGLYRDLFFSQPQELQDHYKQWKLSMWEWAVKENVKVWYEDNLVPAREIKEKE